MKTYISIDVLVAMGCDRQDCIDWFEFRGRKRLTERGLRSIIEESNKKGWHIGRVVKEMADREWISFRASWVKDEEIGFVEKITDNSWADNIVSISKSHNIADNGR